MGEQGFNQGGRGAEKAGMDGRGGYGLAEILVSGAIRARCCATGSGRRSRAGLSRARALRLDNWRTGENPRRWLFTIMHHLFVDQTRKTKRRAEVVAPTLDDPRSLSSPAEQTESIASREIMDALQAISPERRAALVIVGIEGFSYAEAADDAGHSCGHADVACCARRGGAAGLLDDVARRRTIRVVER